MILLDTHVAVWLHTGAMSKLSPRALREIDANELAVSPIVELELGFLHEIGRTAGPSSQVLSALSSSIGLRVAQIGFAPLCSAAVGITWTRDPFDRMLAAHAVVAGSPLLTKDQTILENLDLAFWD